jgi:hypothetical protein
MSSVGWQFPSQNMPSPPQSNDYVYPDPDLYQNSRTDTERLWAETFEAYVYVEGCQESRQGGASKMGRGGVEEVGDGREGVNEAAEEDGDWIGNLRRAFSCRLSRTRESREDVEEGWRRNFEEDFDEGFEEDLEEVSSFEGCQRRDAGILGLY